MNKGGEVKSWSLITILFSIYLCYWLFVSLCVMLLTVSKKHSLFIKWISMYERNWLTGCLLLPCLELRPPRLHEQSSSLMDGLRIQIWVTVSGIFDFSSWNKDWSIIHVKLRPLQPHLILFSSVVDGWEEGRSQIYLWDQISFQTSLPLTLWNKWMSVSNWHYMINTIF